MFNRVHQPHFVGGGDQWVLSNHCLAAASFSARRSVSMCSSKRVPCTFRENTFHFFRHPEGRYHQIPSFARRIAPSEGLYASFGDKIVQVASPIRNTVVTFPYRSKSLNLEP